METLSVELIYEGTGDPLNRNWFLRGETAKLLFSVKSSIRALLTFYLSPFDSPSELSKIYEVEVKNGEGTVYFEVKTEGLNGLYQIVAKAKQIAEMESSSEPGAPISNWNRSLGEVEYVYRVEREVEEPEQKSEIAFPSYSLYFNGTSSAPKYNYQVYPWMIAVLNDLKHEGSTKGLPPLTVPLGLGINVSYGLLADETSETKEIIKLIMLAGISVLRIGLYWSDVEKERGKYDFSTFEKLAEKLSENGLRPLFILAYTNKLYDEGLSPHTETGVKAFSSYVEQAVKALSKYDPIWEIWNEPNGFWWPKPDPEAYAKLAVAALRKIAGKGQTVIGPSVGSFDYNFLIPFLDALKENDLYDELSAVSVHPYRTRSWGPETATPEYEALKKVSKKIVVNSEWGYPCDRSAGSRSLDPLRQAQFFARIYLTDLMNKVPLTTLHDLRDDGTDPFYWEHCYGILQAGSEKERGMRDGPVIFVKPNYYALHHISYELNGYSFIDYVRSPQGIYVLRFKKRELTKYVVWSTTGKQEFTLRAKGIKATLAHLFGKTEEIRPEEGLFRIPVSESPAFLQIAED